VEQTRVGWPEEFDRRDGVTALHNFSPLKAGRTETSQAQVLAGIAVAVVTCASHPCLGDSERDVRKQLHNKIVSDGTFYYSDLATAYPPARKFLSGVAE
jgi:hypothetical protein